MADLNLGTYSADSIDIIISVKGVTHKVSGFGENSVVSVERARESSRAYLGADNSAVRVFDPNKSGTITLTLNQSSSTNDLLTQIQRNDNENRDSSWLFAVLIKDNSGRSFYDAKQCYISQIPSSDFSTDITERVWVINAFNLEQHIGGNALIDPSVVQAIEAAGGTVEDRWKA